MATIRNNNPSYQALLAFWKKHCTLEKWHIDWLKENIAVIQHLSKGDTIHLEGERQKNIYFVSRGAIARVRSDANGKTHILSVALPGMALMSTAHLFSRTSSRGNIIVLHAKTSIIKIPYTAISMFMDEIPEIHTLVNILSNKKKKLLVQLRLISSIKEPIERCLSFTEHLQYLKNALTHKEVAQLLGVSTNTVFRASIIWKNR